MIVKVDSISNITCLFLSFFHFQGVMEYSVSLFFSKLVSYMFLYWLPMYIKKSTSLSPEFSAYMSVPFDLGGILGSVAAGIIADRTGSAALTCIVMLGCAIPSLFLYQSLGHVNLIANILLQTLAGVMVNGPYCLITTAVSADLGNSVKSSNAMATVTAIIDGTGSIGAGVGPLLVGILFTWSLDSIFYVAMLADFISLMILLRIGRNEWRRMRSNRENIN